ncbi:MAG TPA: LPS export ABC transporter periplasmic protein LptC [Steroidobacteraceae bacterium]|nr:LPS export ABC transporter periplasmic protein LptC [Steroidobacteraceae bacterium]
MRSWLRPLGFVAAIVIIAGAYFIGRAGRSDDDAATMAAEIPDPGYAARDAVVIETGYDGRERYRLNAQVIRQQIETGNIELEQLEMHYHPGVQGELSAQDPGPSTTEVWHLKSDRGQVRADGDDVQLNGNVEVTGPAPGSNLPFTLTTQSLRINTPTEFIETSDPVRLRMGSGNELEAVGMEADLKAGNVSLKSQVHGSSAR